MVGANSFRIHNQPGPGWHLLRLVPEPDNFEAESDAMLLTFTVENWGSFRDRTELSFISTSRKDEPTYRFDHPSTKHGVLPVVGVWGANASGKSNLLRALETLREMVKLSWKALPTEPLPHNPFAFRKDDPTTFAISFTMAGVVVDYQVSFNRKEILREHLAEWPESRKRVLVDRQGEASGWRLAKGITKAIRDATRANSLLLSTGAQFNHPRLSEIARALQSQILPSSHFQLTGYPVFNQDSPHLDERVLRYLPSVLRQADIGVVDIRRVERAREPKFLEQVRREVEAPKFNLELVHQGPNDVSFELRADQESRGTWVFFTRIRDVVEVLRSGGALLFDEIETSLHPDLCVELVKLFTNPETNPNRAQLLFSTHYRELLDVVRGDEAAIVEKTREGVSTLHTASDFQSRARDVKSKLHAGARIGGVPALRDLGAVVIHAIGDASDAQVQS